MPTPPFNTLQKKPELDIVNAHLHFPQVSLIEPSPSHFLHIAAEIDKRLLPFLPSSRVKRQVVASVKERCAALCEEPGVLDASVFVARIIPPGQGEYAKQCADRLHIARFDVAVLIECESAAALQRVRLHPACKDMERAIAQAASYVHTITATNPRRIGPVDHRRQGVFLFNYFAADSVTRNIGVWDYTAGWFQAETRLDNSTVLLPTQPEKSQYSIINHCRWGRLTDILPSLIFKRTFRSYVLENFAANKVAAMPILYRLA